MPVVPVPLRGTLNQHLPPDAGPRTPSNALMLPAAFASHFVLSNFFPQRQSNIYDVLLANHTAGLDNATLNLAQYIGVTRTYKHFADRWVRGTEVGGNGG